VEFLNIVVFHLFFLLNLFVFLPFITYAFSIIVVIIDVNSHNAI